MQNMKSMKTNEQNRIQADRRIPLNIFDILFEFLGNMKGKKQKIAVENRKLIAYNNDTGFSEADKKALHVKNQSGNNTHTAGLNGYGIKLAIDRILPKEEKGTVYSINDGKKCFIGHFEHSDWFDCSVEDKEIINKYSENNTGSLFIIPLTDEWLDKFNELAKQACLKYANILISNKEIEFYWNNEIQEQKKICPDEGSLTLNYTLGYNTKKNITEFQENHKLPLLLKIDNYEELSDNLKDKIPEFTHINNKLTISNINKSRNTKEFKLFESGIIKLNVCKSIEEEKILNFEFKTAWIDGCHIYINNRNINLKAIRKHLHGDHGYWYDNCYHGKPRFENHISKKTIQYSIPQDKTNIKPTNKGEYVLRFISTIAQLYFKPSQDTSPSPSPVPVPVPVPVVHPRTIPDTLKHEIWIRAFGDSFYGSCFTCNRIIRANFESGTSKVTFGHIESYKVCLQNVWYNLLPQCLHCNCKQGDTHMDEFKKKNYPFSLDKYYNRKKTYLKSIKPEF